MAVPRINLIGAYAYSSTGGIQAVNRFLISELAGAGLLRKAYLLWDDEGSASAEGRGAAARGWVDFFGLRKSRFIFTLLAQSLRYPNDLWLCTHVNYALLGLFLTGWRRKKVALFIYAAEMDDDFTDLKLFALRRFTRLIAISEYTKRKAVRLGVPAERIHVMHIGVADPCPGWQPRDKAGRPSRVLFVGRLDERYKGQLELLDAMLLLRDRFSDLRLVFVGGGKAIDHWKQEATRRGLGQLVEFAGRVSDERLAEEYLEATIFVMLSENEGFGLVYTEAMARGVPCIAGDRDAAREVLEHGVTGLCVPAGNSTALADAISQLLRSPEQTKNMGLAGRERFLRNFSATQYRARLLAQMQDWCDTVSR